MIAAVWLTAWRAPLWLYPLWVVLLAGRFHALGGGVARCRTHSAAR